MRLSPFEKYINYFEGIANRHPKIKWFHSIDLDEIVSGNLRSSVKPPCMFLEFPEPNAFDNSADTDVKIPSGLAILEPVDFGDARMIKEVIIRTELIILDIVSKMREDREKGVFHLNTNDLHWSKVTGMFSANWTGWRLDLKYQHWIDLNYYPEEWQEYNPDKFKEDGNY